MAPIFGDLSKIEKLSENKPPLGFVRESQLLYEHILVMLVLGIVIWHITLDLTLEIENFSEFKQPLKVADIVIKARDTSDRTKLFFCG